MRTGVFGSQACTWCLSVALPRPARRINEPHYSLIKTHPLEQPHAIFVRREQFQRAPRTA